MFGPSRNTVGTDPFPTVQLHYTCHQAYRLRYMNYFGLDRYSYQKSVVLHAILGQAMKTKTLLPAPDHTQRPFLWLPCVAPKTEYTHTVSLSYVS